MAGLGRSGWDGCVNWCGSAVRTLLTFGFLAGLLAVLYDEAAGRQVVSRTLLRQEGGLDLAPFLQRGELIAALFIFLVVLYVIEPKFAIGAGILILISMLLAGR